MIIDVFNHFFPKAYFERLTKLLPDQPLVKLFPRLEPLVDLDARLRLIDRFPDVQQVLSLSNPPLELVGPPTLTPELARLANDSFADICSRYPEKFPAFVAAVPTNNMEATLVEIDRAINHLGARGIQLFTNVAGKPLSDPEFRPIFRRMAEHDLPVWIHPIRSAQVPDYPTEATSQDEIWFCFGWPYETTACMTRLIYSGIFDELPNLKIISHHMGGMIPFFSCKIKMAPQQIFFGTVDENPYAIEKGLKKPPVEYYKMLYADTAVSGDLSATRCGHDFFGSGHTLFGTDAPFDCERGYGMIAKTIEAVKALNLPAGETEQILAGNTRRLLRL